MSPASVDQSVFCLDAKALAGTGSTWECAALVAPWPRLQAAQARVMVPASVHLRFTHESSWVLMQGQIRAVLELVCQCCLQPMRYPVEESFTLALVANEAAQASLPADCEAVEVDATCVDVSWWVEEQLLLALPLIPQHASAAECHAQNATIGEGAVDEKACQETVVTEQQPLQQPFKNLRTLLKGGID